MRDLRRLARLMHRKLSRMRSQDSPRVTALLELSGAGNLLSLDIYRYVDRMVCGRSRASAVDPTLVLIRPVTNRHIASAVRRLVQSMLSATVPQTKLSILPVTTLTSTVLFAVPVPTPASSSTMCL
jgi:hypothetical protein